MKERGTKRENEKPVNEGEDRTGRGEELTEASGAKSRREERKGMNEYVYIWLKYVLEPKLKKIRAVT